MNTSKTILGISGSLRAGSSNHAILEYLAHIAPDNIDFNIYNSLALIPPFDPSLDGDRAPDPVFELRSFIKHADAVIICSPEYAFGVPGSLKNLLDWTVGSSSLEGKPLALVTASTGGQHAHAALQLILKSALGANVLEDATLLIPFVRSKIEGEGNITDVETKNRLQSCLAALLKAI